jgi:hypothetical protein
MTKAIKQALSEAGLLESLQQEAINSQPLSEPTIAKIKSFVSINTTNGVASVRAEDNQVQPQTQPTQTARASNNPPTDNSNVHAEAPSRNRNFEGIDINDIDEDSEDEDLLDDI